MSGMTHVGVLQIPDRLGDAFYLMAHNVNSGKRLLAERITHTALGAAMLAELSCYRLVGFKATPQGSVVVLPQRYPVMPDLVQHLALDELASETQPLVVWMRHLGPRLIEPIAERLERGGWLEERHSLRVELPFGLTLSRPRRWRPVVPLKAETAALHLDGLLRGGLRFDFAELVLTALVYAASLHRAVFPYATAEHAERVRREAEGLPPPFPELIRELNLAVNRIVATGRH